MQVIVSGRHIAVSDAVKVYCTTKAERLIRFYDRIRSIEVILDGHEGRHSAEIIVHAEGTHPFVASQDDEDVYAAVDLLLDKIEAQIRRHKERLRNRKHPAGGGHE